MSTTQQLANVAKVEVSIGSGTTTPVAVSRQSSVEDLVMLGRTGTPPPKSSKKDKKTKKTKGGQVIDVNGAVNKSFNRIVRNAVESGNQDEIVRLCEDSQYAGCTLECMVLEGVMRSCVGE